MTNGKTITPELTLSILDEEAAAMIKIAKAGNLIQQAKGYLATTVQGKEYAEFLTTLCYDFILAKPSKM
jgi:malate synthase